MKAVLLNGFGPPEVMRIGDAPRPEPRQAEVLVKVATTSVNRPDIIQRRGKYPPPPGDSEILGLEVAGTVESIGPGATGFTVGDRVLGLVGGGAYAEYAVVHASHLLAMPAGMSFAEAACVCETYITAHMNLLGNARLQNGESVLLHGGGGGVNTAAIHIVGALMPESPIYVTASTGKVDRVAALGADLVIDYRNQDFAAEILAVTNGRGVDVILDHLGAAYLKQNLKCLAINGRLALIGTMGGSEATINLGRMLVKRHTIVGSVLRPRPVPEKAQIIAAFARDVLPHFESGAIRPLIDRIIPIDDVVAAHQAMERSEHFGKIVLTL